MAQIYVSSDADTPPVVRVSTAKSGVLYGELAAIQPYAEFNKEATLDRYLYNISLVDDEQFLMILATEDKHGVSYTVQAALKLLSCEGTSIFVPFAEDDVSVIQGPANIFDTKVKIGSSPAQLVAESEFLYTEGGNLEITAIIENQEAPLQFVEIRSITMGQTEDQYVSHKMNITPLGIDDALSFVSTTIPSFLLSEPGMTYWLYIKDTDGKITESIHYNIGVKSSYDTAVDVEVDMPTARASGATINPEFYIFNDIAPSYGTVSLVVDGEVVSKKAQYFGAGQTHMVFDWSIPKSDDTVNYEIYGVVDLYGDKFSTVSSTLVTHPKTVSVPLGETLSLQNIEHEGQIVADPALVYASNADDSLRFTVTDPAGQCIIGGAAECLVNESTRGNRGGLESVVYGDQILRVRYSGAENALERFSITSIDPIVGDWSVTLESVDGPYQQAHASEDTTIKVKYRYHSDTFTVKSG